MSNGLWALKSFYKKIYSSKLSLWDDSCVSPRPPLSWIFASFGLVKCFYFKMLNLNPQGLKDWKHCRERHFTTNFKKCVTKINGWTTLKQKQYLNLRNKMDWNFDGLQKLYQCIRCHSHIFQNCVLHLFSWVCFKVMFL